MQENKPTRKSIYKLLKGLVSLGITPNAVVMAINFYGYKLTREIGLTLYYRKRKVNDSIFFFYIKQSFLSPKTISSVLRIEDIVLNAD